MDRLYLLPVYPANEAPIPGATAEAVAQTVSRASAVDVRTVEKEDVLEVLDGEIESFPVIVFLGAGDIVELADEFVAGGQGI